MATMAKTPQVSRFRLYGERDGALPPEFVHIEPISARSRLHQGPIAPHAPPGLFQILLFEAGTGILATDGEQAALTPGTVVALPVGCVHAFRFAPEAEGWVLSIAADLLNDPRIATLCPGSGQSGGSPRWLCLDGDDRTRLGWLLADLAAALTRDRAGMLRDAVAARLTLLLALVEEQLQSLANSPTARGAPRERLVERFRGLVELHFRDGWTVDSYARQLGATAVTLTRATRAVLGRAPGEVVLDRVLLEAMRSLTYSTAPVSQIASDLGFADNAYFARFFRTRSGMTASAFRHERGWFART